LRKSGRHGKHQDCCHPAGKPFESHDISPSLSFGQTTLNATRLFRDPGAPCSERDAHDQCFSKKVENHALSVAIHYMHYNYCRIQKTLRVNPAMAAG
jgi:hypothetical protein